MGLLSRLFRPEAEIVDDAPESLAVIVRRQEMEDLRTEAGAPEMDADGNDPMADVAYARVVKREDGYGYEVCVGGVPVVVQDFHPEREGDVPMEEAEANAMAAKALRSYRGGA